jgi:hypothetical protein
MLLEAPAPPQQGTVRFIRYGLMPNRLRYGGGDDGSHRALFEYAVAGVSDDGLMPLLRRFTGALPYLQLISRANAIADPFDARVVEAYWLGNELLDRVEVRQLYDSLLSASASSSRAAPATWCWARRRPGRAPTTASTCWTCTAGSVSWSTRCTPSTGAA